MKSILYPALFIAIIGGALQLVLPWWIVVIAAALLSFIINAKSAFAAFLSGFLGIGALWFCYALFIHLKTGGILTPKVAAVLTLSNSFLLLIITALIGGLVAGMGALTGNLFRQMLR